MQTHDLSRADFVGVGGQTNAREELLDAGDRCLDTNGISAVVKRLNAARFARRADPVDN